jgi:hypothetical protein
MRKWKLAATATAASGILAVGLFAAFTLTAKAGTTQGTWCTNSYTGTAAESTALDCTATNTFAYPTSIVLTGYTNTSADDQLNANLPVTFVWSSSCTEQSAAVIQEKGTSTPAASSSTPVFTLYTNQTGTSGASGDMDALDPTSCTVTVTATVSGDNDLTATEIDIADVVTQSAAATATTATPTATTSTSTTTAKYNNQVHGFDGTCLDDKGNSSARRASVIIWTCNNTDQAQGWSHSGSELKIHGMCLNAKGNGKQGSKLILWNCTGTGNEIFSHRSNGEFVEKANGYSQCIDDPGYSTKNGTQPFMYKCNDGANQRWSLP